METPGPPHSSAIALKISLAYAFLGVLWILFSDLVLFLFTRDPETITRIGIFKGWFYVAVTTFLLYGLVRHNLKIIERSAGELRDSEERHRIIAQTASDAILTIDEQNVAVLANPACEKIFGYRPEEIIGREITMLMPPYLRQKHLDALRKFIESGRLQVRSGPVQFPGLRRDGREVPLEIGYGVFRKEGKFFFTGIVRDITERKLAQEEREYSIMLEKFNTELESVITERTLGLLALDMADKVRAPAVVIGWAADKIQKGEGVPERARREAANISEQAGKLESAVREFQSLIKSKEPVFSYEDINGIADGVIGIIKKQAAEKNVELELCLSEKPLRINAQKDLLRMALFSILKNAVDSAPPGGKITLSTTAEDGKIILEVTNGGYIPKEVLDRIFEPATAGSIYRAGIALPLIKQIISEHLGRIEAESSPEKGTAFKLVFPERWLHEADRLRFV